MTGRLLAGAAPQPAARVVPTTATRRAAFLTSRAGDAARAGGPARTGAAARASAGADGVAGARVLAMITDLTWGCTLIVSLPMARPVAGQATGQGAVPRLASPGATGYTARMLAPGGACEQVGRRAAT